MIPSALPIIVEAGQGETTLLPENASQVWKATGETTDGALDLWVEVVPPRLGPPQHLHAHHDEFFWIVKGTFLVKVADRTALLSEPAEKLAIAQVGAKYDVVFVGPALDGEVSPL